MKIAKRIDNTYTRIFLHDENKITQRNIANPEPDEQRSYIINEMLRNCSKARSCCIFSISQNT